MLGARSLLLHCAMGRGTTTGSAGSMRRQGVHRSRHLLAARTPRCSDLATSRKCSEENDAMPPAPWIVVLCLILFYNSVFCTVHRTLQRPKAKMERRAMPPHTTQRSPNNCRSEYKDGLKFPMRETPWAIANSTCICLCRSEPGSEGKANVQTTSLPSPKAEVERPGIPPPPAERAERDGHRASGAAVPPPLPLRAG